MSSNNEYILGIDLGTTNSCVGVWRKDAVEILELEQGLKTMPSYVAFDGKERLIGIAAKQQAAVNHQNTVFDAKRLIGRKFSDKEVQSDMKNWPFKVIQGERDTPKIVVEANGTEQEFTAEDISGMVLYKLKTLAEAKLGQKVHKAVITVPAYFNEGQKLATIEAGKLAGLEVLEIVVEPTAAAVAYGFTREANEKKTIMVFDLGGGTFDVSLLTMDNGTYKVKAVNGDTHLGGEDFDNLLVDYCIKEFEKKHKVSMTDNQKARRRLRSACEKAKCHLSSATTANVNVDSLYNDIDLDMTVTRARFEELCNAHLVNTLEPVRKVLEDSRTSKNDIAEVVLVGGSTRIPKVKELLSEFFNGKKLNETVNVDEAVAYGAAILAAQKSDSYRRASSSSGSKAMRKLKDLNIQNAAPLSYGISIYGDRMSVIIPRTTAYPARKTHEYTTVFDNQDTVSIIVYQGERPTASDNFKLGEFKMEGLPLRPAGKVPLEVTFDIDSNGILFASARETSVGNAKNSITIAADKGRRTPAEVEQALAVAKQFEEQDRINARSVAAKVELETFCTQKLATASAVQKAKIEAMLEWISDYPKETEFTYQRKLAELRDML